MSIPIDPKLTARFGSRRTLQLSVVLSVLLFCLLLGAWFGFGARPSQTNPWDTLLSRLSVVAIVLGLGAGLLWSWIWNRHALSHQSGRTPMTRWQASRPVSFSLAALITLIALFYAVENWRGAQAWAAAQALVKAQGECLDLSCVLAPPIPDERNFARTPAIAAALTQVRAENQPAGLGGYTLDQRPEAVAAWARLFGFRLSEPRDSKKGLVHSPGRKPNGRLDLVAWREAQHANTNFTTLPDSGSAAADLLALLQQKADLIDEIAMAAEQRPEARYPTHPEELFAALLPHLGWVRGAARTYCVRSAARLATGDRTGAFSDARVGFRLGETLKDEHYLIAQLLRFGVQYEANRALAEGLAEHSWTDAQLSEWQNLLAAMNIKEDMLSALRMERATSCLSIELIRNQPALWVAMIGETSGSLGPLSLIPSGWWRQNQAVIVNFYQNIMIHAAAAPPGLLADEASSDADFMRYALSPRPYSFLSRLLMPALSKASSKANRAIITSRMANVACALERHRLKHGAFPDSLTELESAVLTGPIPLDLDGKPLRYERTKDGWYKLYSIGFDGRDDGGEFRANEKGPELDWPWPVPVGEGRRLF